MTNRSTPSPAEVLATVLATLVLLAPVLPAFPYDPTTDARLLEIGAWRDTGGGGADLRFRLDPDGDRLLLMGFGAPGEVRVTDLDTSNGTVLEIPDPDFVATGCDWSMTGERIVVWGMSNGTPVILLYDVPSLAFNGTAPWTGLVTLGDVSVVKFLAYDLIVAVAGRDADGLSRLMFIETQQQSVRWNHEWAGNETILAVEDTGGEVLILDAGETLTIMRGNDWNDFDRREHALLGGPSAWSVQSNSPWILGDSEGRVVVTKAEPDGPFRNITVTDTPLLGVSWIPFRNNDFAVATAIPGGGSRLAAWQVWGEPGMGLSIQEMSYLELEGTVTMIVPDPRGPNELLVATDDGTLHRLIYDIRPYPIEIPPGDPDQVDGRGLEPLLLWNPGGRSSNPRFYFNHQGSLLVLRGFGSEKDLRVVNRTFGTVAQLSVPWNASGFGGLEWSHGDRWLVMWGYVPIQDRTELALRAYDAPGFGASTTFPGDRVLEAVADIHSMEFLPGDRVLVVAGLDYDSGYLMVHLDLQTGKVIKRIPAADSVAMWDLRSDGSDLVGIYHTEGIWTLPREGSGFSRRNVGPSDVVSWDVNSSSGWCLVEGLTNVSMWNGTPREDAFRWEVWPDQPIGLVWSNGCEGDLILGSLRFAGGSYLQLWRRGSFGNASWRSMDGYTMVSELNTSRSLAQLEADPAYPGLVVASFTDGVIAVYHLNLTPYPPPPEDLGDLSAGPIYPIGDGGEGGDGGDLPWGSANDWVMPVALVVTIVVLLFLLVVLRRSERLDDDD